MLVNNPNFNPDNATPEELRQAWQEAKDAADSWRGIESTLRKKVVERHTDITDADAEGTETVELPMGKVLKIKRTLTRSLDDKVPADSNTGKSPLDIALERIEREVKDGETIADRLVSFKPSLSKSEYDKAPNEVRAIIDTVITVKPGSTSIEIATPKRD